jgi:hypothetical protein
MENHYTIDVNDPSKHRRTYYEIKSSVLEMYYDGTISFILNNNKNIHETWDFNSVMGFCYQEMIYWCEKRPIEHLMLELVILITWGAWNVDIEKEKRIKILEILQNSNINYLLKDIPEEECIFFLNDLKKVIRFQENN